MCTFTHRQHHNILLDWVLFCLAQYLKFKEIVYSPLCLSAPMNALEIISY